MTKINKMTKIDEESLTNEKNKHHDLGKLKKGNFRIDDKVSVSLRNYKQSVKYFGTVRQIDRDLINRGAPNWGSENYLYVEFRQDSAYDDLLLRGWSIYCIIRGCSQKCIIREVIKTHDKIDSLVIIIDDGKYNIHNTEYKIPRENILSILIYHVGFKISKI